MSVRDFLSTLNEKQLLAATKVGRHCAIVGTPGSGKTRTLTGTCANLVASAGVHPEQILCMTFTKAAVQEMRSRLGKLLGGAVAGGMRIGTIHSLSRELALAGAPMLFQGCEFDEFGQMQLEIKYILSTWQIKKRWGRKRPKFDLEYLRSCISHVKQHGLAPVAYDAFGTNKALAAAHLHAYLKDAGWDQATGLNLTDLVELVYELDEKRQQRGLFDFDDMQFWGWLSLVSQPNQLKAYQQRFKYVLMDEAQDSNAIQWDVARLIAGLDSCILKTEDCPGSDGLANRLLPAGAEELCPEASGSGCLLAYGDSSQSLYSWRGALPTHFVRFAEREDVELLSLSLNYRSVPGICETASRLVEGKPWHLAGRIVSAQEEAIESKESHPLILRFDTPDVEVDWAVKSIMEEVADSAEMQYGDAAILARTSTALDLAEIACIHKRVPYVKLSGGSFLRSKEVRDILAYLEVACGTDRDYKGLRRCINAPFRFIGKAFIEGAYKTANKERRHMLEVLVERGRGLKPQQRSTLQALVRMLTALSKTAAEAEKLAQANGQDVNDPDLKSWRDYPPGPTAMIVRVLTETDYINRLRREEGVGAESHKTASLIELQRIARRFRSPIALLNYIQELAATATKKRKKQKQGDRNALVLCTIHGSKGQEYKTVRLIDVAEGRLPHPNNPLQDEELRLLYVALTRAKKLATVSYSGEPSAYIGQLASIIHAFGGTPFPQEKQNDNPGVSEERPECACNGTSGCADDAEDYQRERGCACSKCSDGLASD